MTSWLLVIVKFLYQRSNMRYSYQTQFVLWDDFRYTTQVILRYFVDKSYILEVYLYSYNQTCAAAGYNAKFKIPRLRAEQDWGKKL